MKKTEKNFIKMEEEEEDEKMPLTALAENKNFTKYSSGPPPTLSTTNRQKLAQSTSNRDIVNEEPRSQTFFQKFVHNYICSGSGSGNGAGSSAMSRRDEDLSSSTRKVFGNPTVLQDTGLLHYLSTRDLIRCRRVNLALSQKCTKLLMKREDCMVQFKFGSTTPHHIWDRPFNFYLGSNPKMNLKLLTEHLTSLKKIEEFPWKRFSFDCGNLLGRSDFQKFLHIYGNHIQSLTLKRGSPLYEKPLEFQIFRRALLQQLPNLETLTLHSVPMTWDNDIEADRQFLNGMPKLTSFTIETRPSFDPDLESTEIGTAGKILELILQAGGNNLQNCRVSGGVFFPVFQFVGKLHLLRHLVFQPVSWDMDHFAGFLNSPMPIRLEKLTIDWPDLNDYAKIQKIQPEKSAIFAAKCLAKILIDSSKTLTELVVTHPLEICSIDQMDHGYGPTVKWPRMTKLSKIIVQLNTGNHDDRSDGDHDDENADEMVGHHAGRPLFDFQKGLKFKDIFPAFETISFNSCLKKFARANLTHDQLYLLAGTARGVKTLEIYNELDRPEWLAGLKVLFPNLENLKLDGVANFIGISKEIWNMGSSLRSLHIGLLVSTRTWRQGPGGNGGENEFTSLKMDAAFTGFGLRSCAQFLREGRSKMYDDNVEDVRMNSSILDLTNLQKLDLTLSNWCPWEESERDLRILSQLTKTYALDLMPNLDVTVKAQALTQCPRNLEDCIKKLEYVAPSDAKWLIELNQGIVQAEALSSTSPGLIPGGPIYSSSRSDNNHDNDECSDWAQCLIVCLLRSLIRSV